MVTMGRTVMPGVFMSMSRKEIPDCCLAFGSVRTRQKMKSAYWAWVIHVFWPLTTYPSPRRSARVFKEARSDPEPGSEYPWHHECSAERMRGRKLFFWSSFPKV